MIDRLERRDLLTTNVIGDFDGDGADDLAIGVPNEDVGNFDGAGVQCQSE